MNHSTTETISLTPDLLLGKGTRRSCYRHPQDATLCIKTTDGSPEGIRQQKREMRYLKKLKKRGANLKHIAEYQGTVTTDQGPGYLYDIVLDYDGTPSKDLAHCLSNLPDQAEKLVLQFNELLEYFLRERIIFYDLNGWNVLCQKQADGSFTLVIIDGIGEVVALPILNVFPSHLHKTIRRRWVRVHRRMTKRHPDLAHLFIKA